MTLDETIKRYKNHSECIQQTLITKEEAVNVYEWLRELKKYRAIFEKVGKILADNGYTIDDLDTIFGKVNDEVNAESDKGVLEKINEKQDSLRATCKAWDEAISRDGYVN